MSAKLDMDKVARGLGAERRGAVKAGGGYFGAAQLAAEVEARFRAPPGGGRATDPAWTERRLVPMDAATLAKLEALAGEVAKRGVTVGPLQVAALLLQQAVNQVDDEALRTLTGTR
ncbi:MAG: hypothetical protein U0324_18635 [Polyangiales bacterium]|jgi:hypothetical protein